MILFHSKENDTLFQVSFFHNFVLRFINRYLEIFYLWQFRCNFLLLLLAILPMDIVFMRIFSIFHLFFYRKAEGPESISDPPCFLCIRTGCRQNWRSLFFLFWVFCCLLVVDGFWLRFCLLIWCHLFFEVFAHSLHGNAKNIRTGLAERWKI